MEHKLLGKTWVPAIGQGTMDIKDSEMLKLGIEYGMTFIDTAENYGHSEELVGRAIKNYRRKDIFIATKVSPEHLSHDDVLKSVEGSLRRLQTDYIDLYQIHWPNPSIPFEETFGAMEKLVKDGKVRYLGVSNFSLKQLKLASGFVSIQVEYNLFDRTIEEDILPYCQKHGILVIAYSPLNHGKILNRTVQRIAKEYHKTPVQIALNWLVSKQSVIAIPKAVNANHVKENASATDFELAEEDIKLINGTFINPIYIHTDRINVNQDDLDKFVPTPRELAKDIQNGERLKPIHVQKSISGKYEYDLVEGKVRYWAQVFAYGMGVPIQALVRELS